MSFIAVFLSPRALLSDSDVYIRQILTIKVDPRTVRGKTNTLRVAMIFHVFYRSFLIP